MLVGVRHEDGGALMHIAIGELERFAVLVDTKAQAAERDACAQVCEKEADRALWNWHNDLQSTKPFWNGAEQLASGCAEYIRARGAT